jgi:rhamnosyltransferase
MNKIINSKEIAILMATYNGEKYLREQMDSIINQINQSWILYIQDDGSNDGTIDIIKEYSSKFNNIIYVDLGLTRQGACMNFMSLLNVVESEYYMFSDQDDVWLPNKVEISLKRMKAEELLHPGLPIIVHADKIRVDANLNVILPSELNRKNLSKEKLAENIKERNSLNLLRLVICVSGCAMCFNRKVKEVSFPFTNCRMQDSIVTMAVAKAGGIIATIFEPVMLYRIHNTNTCGVRETSFFHKFSHLNQTLMRNMMMFYLWKIYGGGNFFKFLYYRYRLFMTRQL